jgi:hypothetical protein
MAPPTCLTVPAPIYRRFIPHQRVFELRLKLHCAKPKPPFVVDFASIPHARKLPARASALHSVLVVDGRALG